MTSWRDLEVVCGGGGFIGGHLIADLRRQGFSRIRSVDCKPQSRWYQRFPDVENLVLDLEYKPTCHAALQGAHTVYNHAAETRGMGFIELNKGLCMLSVPINTHLLMAAAAGGSVAGRDTVRRSDRPPGADL